MLLLQQGQITLHVEHRRQIGGLPALLSTIRPEIGRYREVTNHAVVLEDARILRDLRAKHSEVNLVYELCERP